VINQVGILLRELCRLHSLPELSDLERLVLPLPQTGGAPRPAQPASAEDMDDDADDDDEDDTDDLEDHFAMEEAEIVPKSKVCALSVNPMKVQE